MRSLLISLLSYSLITGCAVTQKIGVQPAVQKQNCEITRAAFDIGSGSTRVKVARVDKCKSKVLEVFLEREEKVDFKEDLIKSNSDTFSEDIMNAGIETLRTLKAEADKFSPKEYITVATAAFREAKNGQKFIEKINVELWINPRIISQEEEALLGFYGSADSIGAAPENTVIWDIGGSSQQIVKYNGNDRFSIYEGKLGSVPFKDYIIKKIKRTNTKSPNPINAYQTKLAVEYAKNTALKTVKKDIKEFLANTKDARVIGIGGVHYYSVKNQIDPTGEKDTYTVGDVEKTLNSKIGKTDSDLGNPKYVETDVSNLALVFGFMKALNIYEIKTAKVNMTDGLLLDEKYWTP
jgi:exopolyphosphatase/guanosine-5'-triphosphate,3'-diphosphate pyrophosphatase